MNKRMGAIHQRLLSFVFLGLFAKMRIKNVNLLECGLKVSPWCLKV